jgi:YEATS domain-containing protein 4
MAGQTQKQDIEIIVKKIVYGSVAFWLGKKADESISHKWCVYVRGLENEDISYFVKKVIFTLHPSFENQHREVTKFPFELYESGWGQFDIIITIYLIDETAKPIEFVHPLKLYPTQSHASMSTKKPVVSESYEEIIFVNPKPHIKEILNNPPIKSHSSIQIPMMDEERNIDSYFSDDKMQVEKNVPNASEIVLKDTAMRINNTFTENFNNLNINTQMEISPSNIITPSFQKKVDDLNIDSTMGNFRIGNTFLGEFDQMQFNQEMQIENSIDPSQQIVVNINLF